MRLACLLSMLALTTAVHAHDTWVQANTHVVRVGDVVHVDLMLGNHGNEHRDFKLASKVDLAGSTLHIRTPDGKLRDLKKGAFDTGNAPTEGYWTNRFVAAREGLYTVAHTYDKVVSYAPKRAVKSGKTFFLASRSLDKLPQHVAGFDRPLGHALELVPVSHPVLAIGPKAPIRVRLLYKGRPLANTRISFIPRGVALKEGFDSRYERKTDAKGQASFTPSDGNYYLVSAHHKEPQESGAGYESTEYAATLTLYVPQVRR